MNAEPQRNLSRDVRATRIPEGEHHLLSEGTAVTITHRLGGNFTIMCQYGMFRIAGADADSLGEEVVHAEPAQADHGHEGPPEESRIWDRLKEVFDPEIPVNIVDLGLIYSVDIQEEKDHAYHVSVAMTLTAPGCGMGPVIAEDAEAKIKQVPGVSSAKVDIVWDPPWTQEMISEEGRMELGLV